MRSKMYRSKYTIAMLVMALVMIFNSEGFANTSPTVIKPGSWSLGDTFELRYGQESFHTYSYNELRNLYNNYSYDSQLNEIDFESNELQYQLYCLKYDTLTDSTANYNQLAAQYRTAAKNYEDEMNSSTGAQKDAAQKNMEQSLNTAQTYEAEAKAALLQKAEAYENRENCLFIRNNASTYRNQQYTMEMTEFRNTIYYLKSLDEKCNLQGTYAGYYRLKADEKTISKSKDMSFQSDIDLYNSEYDYYCVQQDLISQQYNDLFEKLLNNSNINTSQGSIINTETNTLRGLALYDNSAYEKSCYMVDIRKKQLEDKLRIIDGKIAILRELYADSSNEVKLVQKERQQTNLELSKWVIQRKNLIKSSYTIYINKFNEIDIAEKKTKALYQKYIILLNKYNYGLTNKIAVKEAELNYIQSSSAAWNTLYEYSCAFGNIERNMNGNIQ